MPILYVVASGYIALLKLLRLFACCTNGNSAHVGWRERKEKRTRPNVFVFVLRIPWPGVSLLLLSVRQVSLILCVAAQADRHHLFIDWGYSQ